MAAPKKSDWNKLKSLARYLWKHVELEIVFSGLTNEQVMVVFVDADWTGCTRTRKSTSGGCMVIAGGCVKNWSSTQGS